MSTFENRPNTALLVIDVQTGVVATGFHRDDVVANIAALVDQARDADVPVIWVQHDSEELPKGSDVWQIVSELVPADNEARIEKQYGDSFEATELESVLSRLAVGSLVVTGAQTDACVRSTLHGAVVRGYDTLLVSDAHTTEDLSEYGAPLPGSVIAHTNLYWQYQRQPGRIAGVIATADVRFDSV